MVKKYSTINGISKITTSVSLKFNVNRSLVGVCSDGDYCVVGGNR